MIKTVSEIVQELCALLVMMMFMVQCDFFDMIN